MEEGIVKDLLDDAGTRMDKSVEATKHEFGSVRTGRASPSLLDRVQVDYYGTATPLKQLATISAPEAQMLTVQPYDQSSIKAIEKSIRESDLGLNPSNDGKLIRLGIPALTEERRREMVKVARGKGEDARVTIRSLRRKAMEELHRIVRDGEAGEDEVGRAEKELQATVDKYVHQIDELVKHKEAELLEV
jgi:ribosome recycling factor